MKMQQMIRMAGYTLVEMMIVTGVITIVMAGVMTEYVSLIKGYETVNTYRDLHSQARYGVDQFTRDLRAASGITSGTTNSISFTVPASAGTENISYSINDQREFVRQAVLSGTTNTMVVARNVEAVQFDYYLRNNTTATNATMAFNVHARVTCSRGVAGVEKVDFIHTRTLLRNKQS